MNYWIFQCKQDRYNIADPDVLYSGMKGYWLANQYRSDMKPGDKVFFWLAGESSIRGIYGYGVLTSPPYKWERGEDVGYSVDIMCTERLNRFIPVADIKGNIELHEMRILNMAIGSNFLLSTAEGQEIESMLQRMEA
jgi:predicted RNA-binding protein with PUA-like domain